MPPLLLLLLAVATGPTLGYTWVLMRGGGKVVKVEWEGLSQVAIMETRKREGEQLLGKSPLKAK